MSHTNRPGLPQLLAAQFNAQLLGPEVKVVELRGKALELFHADKLDEAQALLEEAMQLPISSQFNYTMMLVHWVQIRNAMQNKKPESSKPAEMKEKADFIKKYLDEVKFDETVKEAEKPKMASYAWQAYQYRVMKKYDLAVRYAWIAYNSNQQDEERLGWFFQWVLKLENTTMETKNFLILALEELAERCKNKDPQQAKYFVWQAQILYKLGYPPTKVMESLVELIQLDFNQELKEHRAEIFALSKKMTSPLELTKAHKAIKQANSEPTAESYRERATENYAVYVASSDSNYLTYSLHDFTFTLWLDYKEKNDLLKLTKSKRKEKAIAKLGKLYIHLYKAHFERMKIFFKLPNVERAIAEYDFIQKVSKEFRHDDDLLPEAKQCDKEFTHHLALETINLIKGRQADLASAYIKRIIAVNISHSAVLGLQKQLAELRAEPVSPPIPVCPADDKELIPSTGKSEVAHITVQYKTDDENQQTYQYNIEKGLECFKHPEKLDDALKYFRNAFQIYPRDYDAASQIVATYVKKGDQFHPECRKLLREMDELRRMNAFIFHYRQQFYWPLIDLGDQEIVDQRVSAIAAFHTQEAFAQQKYRDVLSEAALILHRLSEDIETLECYVQATIQCANLPLSHDWRREDYQEHLVKAETCLTDLITKGCSSAQRFEWLKQLQSIQASLKEVSSHPNQNPADEKESKKVVLGQGKLKTAPVLTLAPSDTVDSVRFTEQYLRIYHLPSNVENKLAAFDALTAINSSANNQPLAVMHYAQAALKRNPKDNYSKRLLIDAVIKLGNLPDNKNNLIAIEGEFSNMSSGQIRSNTHLLYQYAKIKSLLNYPASEILLILSWLLEKDLNDELKDYQQDIFQMTTEIGLVVRTDYCVAIQLEPRNALHYMDRANYWWDSVTTTPDISEEEIYTHFAYVDYTYALWLLYQNKNAEQNPAQRAKIYENLVDSHLQKMSFLISVFDLENAKAEFVRLINLLQECHRANLVTEKFDIAKQTKAYITSLAEAVDVAQQANLHQIARDFQAELTLMDASQPITGDRQAGSEQATFANNGSQSRGDAKGVEVESACASRIDNLVNSFDEKIIAKSISNIDYQAHMKNGQEYFANKLYSQAIQAYEAALNEKPADIDAHLKLIITHDKRKDEAKNDSQAVERLRASLNNIRAEKQAEKKLDAAKAEHDSFVRVYISQHFDPASVLELSAKAVIAERAYSLQQQRRAGEYRWVLQTAQQVISANSYDTVAPDYYIEAAAMLGRVSQQNFLPNSNDYLDNALQMVNRLIQSGNGKLKHYFWQAKIYRHLNKIEEAVASFVRLIELCEKNIPNEKLRNLIYYFARNFASASDQVEFFAIPQADQPAYAVKIRESGQVCFKEEKHHLALHNISYALWLNFLLRDKYTQEMKATKFKKDSPLTRVYVQIKGLYREKIAVYQSLGNQAEVDANTQRLDQVNSVIQQMKGKNVAVCKTTSTDSKKVEDTHKELLAQLTMEQADNKAKADQLAHEQAQKKRQSEKQAQQAKDKNAREQKEAAEKAANKANEDKLRSEKQRETNAAEAKRKADAAEVKRKADADAAKRKADAEAKRKADEAAEAKRKADEAAEAKRKADAAAEAKRKADAAAEAKRKADEAAEAKRKADEAAEAKRKADEAEEAKRKADAVEAKCKADAEEAKRKDAKIEAKQTTLISLPQFARTVICRLKAAGVDEAYIAGGFVRDSMRDPDAFIDPSKDLDHAVPVKCLSVTQQVFHSNEFRKEIKEGLYTLKASHLVANVCNLLLLSISYQNKEIHPGHPFLRDARDRNLPVLIRHRDKFMLYGDPTGTNRWGLITLKCNQSDLAKLNQLPFETKDSIQFNDPLFISLMSVFKQGHSAISRYERFKYQMYLSKHLNNTPEGLLADALGRDFTINALYCTTDNVDEKVENEDVPALDPTGLGSADLAEGRIRCLIDPTQSFAEDGGRILRAIARLVSENLKTAELRHRGKKAPDFFLDEAIQKAINEFKIDMKEIENSKRDYINSVMKNLLVGQKAWLCFREMQKEHVLDLFFPEIAVLLKNNARLAADIILRLQQTPPESLKEAHKIIISFAYHEMKKTEKGLTVIKNLLANNKLFYRVQKEWKKDPVGFSIQLNELGCTLQQNHPAPYSPAPLHSQQDFKMQSLEQRVPLQMQAGRSQPAHAPFQQEANHYQYSHTGTDGNHFESNPAQFSPKTSDTSQQIVPHPLSASTNTMAAQSTHRAVTERLKEKAPPSYAETVAKNQQKANHLSTVVTQKRSASPTDFHKPAKVDSHTPSAVVVEKSSIQKRTI